MEKTATMSSLSPRQYGKAGGRFSETASGTGRTMGFPDVLDGAESVGGGDDDDREERQTADQRAAVSREMTNLLARRLDGLAKLARVWQHAADEDVNPYSKERSKLVRDPRTEEKESVGDTESVSPDARGGRRVKEDDSRFRMPTRQEETDEKEMSMLDSLRKQLHAAETSLMSHMVENIRFRIDRAPPFNVPWKVILHYSALSMVVPQTRSNALQRHLKFWLTKSATCQLLRSAFWYMHCFCFQGDSEDAQEVLLERIAEANATLIRSVKTNTKFFFSRFPFAIAFAVLQAFFYYVPGSRSHYTRAFRLQVYVVMCRLLTGFDMAAVTVQRKAEEYYPEEAPAGSEAAGNLSVAQRRAAAAAAVASRADDTGPRPSTAYASPHLSAPWAARVDAIHSLPTRLAFPVINGGEQLGAPRRSLQRATSAPAARTRRPSGSSIGDTGMPPRGGGADFAPSRLVSGSRARSITAGGRASAVTVLSDASGGNKDRPSQVDREAQERLNQLIETSQGRQVRQSFLASGMSPLMQRFLKKEDPGVGVPTKLKRTTPVSWVRTGGVDTFRRTPQRTDVRKLLQRHVALKEAYDQDTRSLEPQRKQEVEAVLARGKAVLRGGMSHVSKFCLDLSRPTDEEKMRKKKRKDIERKKERERKKGSQYGNFRGSDDDRDEEDMYVPYSETKEAREAQLAALPSPSPLLPSRGQTTSIGAALEYGIDIPSRIASPTQRQRRKKGDGPPLSSTTSSHHMRTGMTHSAGSHSRRASSASGASRRHSRGDGAEPPLSRSRIA